MWAHRTRFQVTLGVREGGCPANTPPGQVAQGGGDLGLGLFWATYHRLHVMRK